MALNRPMAPQVLRNDKVQQLQAHATFRPMPHSIVKRAQFVLAWGAAVTNTAIAELRD